jgi:hypothetical protein
MSNTTRQTIYEILRGYLPPSWFGDTSPVINGLINGSASVMAIVFDNILEAALQLRIKTATGGFLDLVAGDFFGNTLARKTHESDTIYRARILTYMFRERATRNGLKIILTDITGRTPRIVETERPMDTGGYRGGGVGYGTAGAYGSMLTPFQCFVEVYRPPTSGVPFISGYGCSPAGYNVPSQGEYASMSMVEGFVQDTDIYHAIDMVKPIGTIVWTQIKN